MRFGRILSLSSSASGGGRLPSQVISVIVARFFTSYSSSSCGGASGLSAGYSSWTFCEGKEPWNIWVWVFWDYESCNLPAGVNVFRAVQAITTTVKGCGIRGRIGITAFGDYFKLSTFYKDAFSDMGIHSQRVSKGKRTSDKLVDWSCDVPPPAHIFLISSDPVFASALHTLRFNKYNILLASKTYELDALSGAATIMWDWCSLVEGKNVAGVHNKLPPHHVYYSSSGLFPFKVPSAATEQSSSDKTGESRASNSNMNSEESTALSKTLFQIDSCQSVGENETDKSKSSGFFGRILKCFKFWEKDATAVKLGGEPRGVR